MLSAAVLMYDESVSGDLSGDYQAPSILTITNGENILTGSVGNNGNTGGHPDFSPNNDGDYFTFSMADGLRIESIRVVSYTSNKSVGNGSFFGYKAGVSSFPGQNFSDIDGYALFSDTRNDLLSDPPNTSINANSLPSGDYALWIEEINDTVVNYSLSFNVVPEPSTAVFSSLGILLLCTKRSRKT